METSMGVWMTWVVGVVPMLVLLLWCWNELWYAVPLKFRYSGTGTRLPPGYMGIPILGETLTFLWYFKVLRRPDEFINSKRRKYGDGVGLYRTHLFGSPSVIACFPLISKIVYQSDDTFVLQWPAVDLVGRTSLVAVHGKAHDRVRRFVIKAINGPDALRRIADHVQPCIVAALQSWEQKTTVKISSEAKKVTFENIGKLFVSFEPGPRLESLEKLFQGLTKGFRAHPFNFPGTAYHHASQCRKKLEDIFRIELEKRKNRTGIDQTMNIDLMDGLMQIEDDMGKRLSDQEVLDNIVSLVVAGYTSTAMASTWALYFLAKNPNVLEKLREENMGICKNKKENFITSEDVSQLKYTNKVVEETIRMANIAGITFRLVIKEAEYKGYKIPKDWKVIVWNRYLHTNPENFNDPMCFNPDRWNEPASPGTYQAFGGGSRICAGNMLARLQIALLLHHLSIGYKWELVNPDAEIIYLPHPMPLDGVEVKFSQI
ncbi:hypothetical protein EZV62_003363 [Acer yangbiense]|uniref:Uncharacterized protein n=1 Tax=Acer yangbiense TaxID=1000413 RepID=A0A5C7IH76_9ROSI|nr:hypothetical protein EZV62_003363 [Acer yangbiense]